MIAILIADGQVTVDQLEYYSLKYEAKTNGDEVIISSTTNRRDIICQGPYDDLTLNSTSYNSATEFVIAFNQTIQGVAVKGSTKRTTTVVLTAGGNKSFDATTYVIGDSGSIGITLEDVDIVANTTVNAEITYSDDDTTFETLVDSNKDDVSGILVQSGDLTFTLVNIKSGARIRLLFVTNTTGNIKVTTEL